MKMNMNQEIKKYQGNIYYFDRATHEIKRADWIECTDDYSHSYELHHVVPYTDWEEYQKLKTKGKKLSPKYDNMPEANALILILKIMHQHLQNPEYKLPKEKFEQVYGINPDVILYDINSRLERTAALFYVNKQKNNSELTLNDLTDNDIECFGGINEETF